jgi:hypothetical protein
MDSMDILKMCQVNCGRMFGTDLDWLEPGFVQVLDTFSTLSQKTISKAVHPHHDMDNQSQRVKKASLFSC